MFIEVRGSEDMLRALRLNLEDQLQTAGFLSGPRVGSIDAGRMMNYVKGEQIVSIHTEESEAGDSVLRIESERELEELYELWDAALIAYGKKVKQQLIEFASDRQRVERGLK